MIGIILSILFGIGLIYLVWYFFSNLFKSRHQKIIEANEEFVRKMQQKDHKGQDGIQ